MMLLRIRIVKYTLLQLRSRLKNCVHSLWCTRLMCTRISRQDGNRNCRVYSIFCKNNSAHSATARHSLPLRSSSYEERVGDGWELVEGQRVNLFAVAENPELLARGWKRQEPRRSAACEGGLCSGVISRDTPAFKPVSASFTGWTDRIDDSVKNF